QIEQVGTPRQIYWHPVSHFVADFVGYDNFLVATVITADAHGVTVRLDNTELRLDCPARAGITPGQKVEVAMRSASVIMGAPAESMPNRFVGTITDIVYLGDEYIYALQVGPQRLSVSLRTAEVAT